MVTHLRRPQENQVFDCPSVYIHPHETDPLCVVIINGWPLSIRTDLHFAWLPLSCRRRLMGGSPGRGPPIMEKRPCIYHFLPPFPCPNILVCPPNIFDTSTPVAFVVKFDSR